MIPATEPRSCEMNTSATPAERRLFRMPSMCTRLAESKALTGSSRISSSGSVTSARATATR
ncbi:hypothetical protein FDG2_2946 [Candidatus Protofrankia californiensis]|uniref:Uncharacterized protein n=1 Tax=Candidatus Protofrankia californiensis TaxID=1839754 RepID=A0A1C3NYM2_9ACTN|nr:hypothetical protein FDG2_2946 [Candidatus Protofrankia californiensis]